MQPAVYIMASQTRGTLYIGVTSNAISRIDQHRAGKGDGFTAKYGVARLVHVETCEDMLTAISREKQLKRWHRAWKIALIEQDNPTWRDLAADLGFPPLRPKRRAQAAYMDPETSSG